jgi:hypothetical protein
MPLTQVDQGLLGQYAQYTGFKNRIINGAMVIDQRNAGASVTPTNGQYTLDRWGCYAFGSATSKYTVQQNAGSVTPPAGFRNYLGVTSTSAYSVAAGDITSVYQIIEGFNTADLGFGTANAATVTLSFWVRSSLTGTFGGAFKNNAINRSYPFTYTISSANTWEQKSVTVAGDTTGTWVGATNGSGLFIIFSLGTGSTYSSTAGAWVAGDFYSATGATSVIGTNGATLYITGVQLEKGATATSFDYRPYGTELMLCQRYFVKWTGDSSATGFPMVGTGNISAPTTAIIFIPTPAALRTTPTVSFSGSVSINDAATQSNMTSIAQIYAASGTGFWTILTASGGAFTGGNGAIVFIQNASTNSFSASSEL